MYRDRESISKPSNLCDHYQCLCDMILLLIRDSMGCLFTEVLRRSDCVAGSMECGIFANRPRAESRLIPFHPMSIMSFLFCFGEFWLDLFLKSRLWVDCEPGMGVAKNGPRTRIVQLRSELFNRC